MRISNRTLFSYFGNKDREIFWDPARWDSRTRSVRARAKLPNFSDAPGTYFLVLTTTHSSFSRINIRNASNS